MIYLNTAIPMLIHGETPVTPPEPPTDEATTPPTTPPPATPAKLPDETLVPIADLRKVRQEAEKYRKELDAFKQAQTEADEQRKLAEMTEIDRLKKQAKDAEDRYSLEVKARKTESTKAKLVNIASFYDVPVPMFVVNQIPTDRLSEDMTEDDLKQIVQDVIMQAEQAGMPLTRKRADAAPPIAPSPGVGATNPPNAYPPIKLTTPQQIAELQKQFVETTKVGDLNKQSDILRQIKQMQEKMGIRSPDQ